MTKILLVRHGHVEGIHPERFRGRVELPLTELGRQQAQLTADKVARLWQPTAIYTSPLQRCIDTGAAIGQRTSAPCSVLAGLHDLDYGQWQWKTFDEARGLEVNSLLSSGARSWASHDPRVLGGRRPTFVAGRDVNGPLNVGLEVSLPAAAGNDSPRTRIIAFGDADFVSNRFLDYLGNKDLLLNSINWLSRHEALIAPRAKAKKPGKHQFFVSQAEGRRLFWAAVVVQPGLFLAAGVLVLLVRRFSS